VFDPKNRIHWVAAIIIAIILILILGVASTASGSPSPSTSFLVSGPVEF